MLFQIGDGDIFYMFRFNWASLLDIAAQKNVGWSCKKGVKRQLTLDMVQGKGDKDEIYAQYAT